MAVISELAPYCMEEHMGVHWKPNWSASPVRATLFRKVASVLRPVLAVTNTYGVAGYWRANWRNARSAGPWRG
jgi:hypothetical protein